MLRLIFCMGILLLQTTSALAITTNAKQALLIDFQTGAVLYYKNPDQLMAPSSMTKIGTVLMVFDMLQKKKLSLDQKFPVSKVAWKKGGSRTFLDVDTSVDLDTLLRGIAVQSGNDASIVVAEGVSGNEDMFAAAMTEKMRAIGAKKTTFKNATGWPDPEHVTTARDLVLISTHLITQHPTYYKTYFSQPEFEYNKIKQQNRNPLIFMNIGADGIKTGKTDAGGFGLVGSAVQKGRRLILVINGCKTSKERSEEAAKLLSWGFTNTITPKILTAGKELTKADVWLGDKPRIRLASKEDLSATLLRASAKNLKVELHYSEPLTSPVKVGQEVGKIVVTLPDNTVIEKTLIAKDAVEAGSFFERIGAAFNYLFYGSNEKR